MYIIAPHYTIHGGSGGAVNTGQSDATKIINFHTEILYYVTIKLKVITIHCKLIQRGKEATLFLSKYKLFRTHASHATHKVY